MSGAEFSLKPAEGSSFAFTGTLSGSMHNMQYTEATGFTWNSAEGYPMVLTGYLIAGDTYVLTEIKAPEGYGLSRESYRFTVTEEGGIEWVGDAPDTKLAALTDYKEDQKTLTNQINVYNDLIGISLKKLDVNVPDGSGYQDAEFDLYRTDENGGLVKIEGLVLRSDENGVIEIKNTKDQMILMPGVTYSLLETKAPLGYELADAFTFQVDEYGSIKEGSISDQETAAAQKDSSVLQVFDKPITVELVKTDSEGKTIDSSRGEAEFTITPSENGTFADGSTEAITGITPSNIGEMLYAKLIPGQSYEMAETKAPDGYKLAKPFTFMVDVKGNITFVSDEKTAKFDQDSSILTVLDEQEEPEETEEPTETEKPAKTEKPTETEKKAETQKSAQSQSENAAKTADTTQIWLYVLMLCVSGMAGITLLSGRRRRRK